MGTRYRWVILAAGTLAQATFSATTIGLPALAPALRDGYALSLQQVGVVLAAVGIGMLGTLLPWGLLADRIDERWVIAIGLVGCSGALAAAATTDAFGTLTAALVLAGALGASVNAASGRAVMSWFASSEIGLALGIRQTAIPIGGAAGAAALPVLATHGGTSLAFLTLAASTVAGAALAVAFIRTTTPGETPAAAVVAKPLREPQLWILSAGTALFLTAQIGITGYVVLFLNEHRGMSTHSAAWLLAGINVLAIGARILAGSASDRMSDRVRPLIVLGIACAATTAVVAATIDAPLALLLPAFVVAGTLSMSWNALGYAAAAETVGAGRTGAALGFQQTILGVAVSVVPPVFAAIAAASWRVAFLFAAAGPLAGVALLRRLSPRPARTRGTSAIPPAAP